MSECCGREPSGREEEGVAGVAGAVTFRAWKPE